MHHSNAAVINAFMDPTLPTMADIIAVVTGDDSIPVSRRRNLASSIRTFCKALGYEPSKVPANHAYFRERLKRFHPLEAAIKKKRWQTIISDLNAALTIAGITKGQTRGLAPIGKAWADLKSKIEGQKRWGFFRLARYCSNRSLPPEKVNDAVMAAFADAMRTETFKTNIDRLMRELCRQWNVLAGTLPVADLQKVTLPSKLKVVSVPWGQLLESSRSTWISSWRRCLPTFTRCLSPGRSSR